MCEVWFQDQRAATLVSSETCHQQHISTLELSNQSCHRKKGITATVCIQAKDESDDEMDEGEEGEEDAPETARFESRSVAHGAAVNRVRCMHQQPGIVAVWGDNCVVSVLQLSATLTALAEGGGPSTGSTSKGGKGRGPKQQQVRAPGICTTSPASNSPRWTKKIDSKSKQVLISLPSGL